MRLSRRKLLRSCGLLLSAAALAWIGLRFTQSGALDLLARAPAAHTELAAAIAIGACGYALVMGLLALAWWRLIAASSPSPPPAGATMATYAVSQYGKYLPGNVAHYALRHAWSRRSGVPHAGLGLAAVLEALLLLLASFALTLLADTHRLRILSMLDPRIAIALLVAMLIALGFILNLSRRRAFSERLHVPPLPPPATMLFCLGCYAAFFVVGATVLAALARVLGIGIDSFAMLLAASAASWAAGFVVIGAPGGLGIREAAFVALTGSALGESHALLLISFFRVVTFLGDTIFLAAGALALRYLRTDNANDISRLRRTP